MVWSCHRWSVVLISATIFSGLAGCSLAGATSAYTRAEGQIPGRTFFVAVDGNDGWRADCLGDMGGWTSDWYHMRDAYPGQLQEAGAVDTWRSAPVAWESCWDMRRWVRAGLPMAGIPCAN